MLKKIRNLRLVISFVNYLICLYGLYVFDFFSAVKISSFAKVMIVLVFSFVVLLFGIALTYLKKNSNVLYDGIYTIAFFIIIFDKFYTKRIHSDFTLFAILFIVIFTAIYSHYLNIFEKKIKKIQDKDASEIEIYEVYSKYMKILAIFIFVVSISFILLSLAIYTISSRFVMYLYSIDMIFSIPAVIGLILTSIIGVFVLLPVKDIKDKK